MLVRKIKSKSNVLVMALTIAVLFAFSGILTSCGEEISFKPLKKDTSKVVKKEAVKQDEVKKEAPAKEDYVYTSVGKRDPFRSIFDEMGVEADDLGEEAITSPLQEYEVNSFTLTGVVWGVSSPVAMLNAPDNRSYVVKVGTLIGRNWGKVTKIMRDRIVVTEVSRNPSGPKVINRIELKLPVKEIKAGQGGFGYGEVEKALQETEEEESDD